MKRYIKSNGRIAHISSNLLLTLKFVFNYKNIQSSEELKLNIDESIKNYVYNYLDYITDNIINYLVASYPVTVGTPKPNSKFTSVYIPVALLDDSYPGKLRVELGSFACISRISDHTQTKNSKVINDARDSTIQNFKNELNIRVNNEFNMLKDMTEQEFNDKKDIIDKYEFPEDFSIYLLVSQDNIEEKVNNINMLVTKVGDIIYNHLIDINNID